jgi:hypothetical protein
MFASASKRQRFRLSILLAASIRSALCSALAFSSLLASIASAGPQSQSPADPQISAGGTAPAGIIAPSPPRPESLRRHPLSDLAGCPNHLSPCTIGAQSVDRSKIETSGGNIDTKLPLPEHRFWDRRNDLLFAAVGASRALDYSSTLNFRRRGRNEAFLSNDIVDNHAAFAAIEVVGTAVSIGVSYLFHRSHHHRLERWTSIVHAGLATSGAVRNYCLKTKNSSSAP